VAKLITEIKVPLVVTLKSETPIDVMAVMKFFNKRMKLHWYPSDDPPGGKLIELYAMWEHPTVTVEEERSTTPENSLPPNDPVG